jgi:HK97 gp10 family phage protein
MAVTVKVEGLRELEAALRELPKATGKNTLRRALKKAGEPILSDMKAKAPRDKGILVRKLAESGQLSTNERGGGGPEFLGIGADGRKIFSKQDARNFVEIHIGASGNKQSYPVAFWAEFGTNDTAAHPFARPAWEGNKEAALATVSSQLRIEIDKAVARRARKLAKG